MDYREWGDALNFVDDDLLDAFGYLTNLAASATVAQLIANVSPLTRSQIRTLISTFSGKNKVP